MKGPHMSDTIAIYGANWCPDCRRAKKFLADQRIAYEWHDVEADPEAANIVQERNDGANTIPTIVFPDDSHLAEPTDEELAEKLGLQRSAMQHVYDLIVVGGGPTGLTTGIYAARENLETLIVDSKGLGGQAGITERLDNYPGFPDGIAGAELADRFVRQAERFGVETLQAVSVTSITDDGHRGLDVATATGDHYHSHAVLIATGSSYRRTDAPGEEALIGAGIHFCATCDGPFYKGEDELMVIGGGNSGLEEGLFLTQFVDRVCVVEYDEQLQGSSFLRDKVMNHPKMQVLTNRAVQEFKTEGDGTLGTVLVQDRATGEVSEHHPAGVFVFIGLDPNTGFLDGQFELDDAGFIATDATLMTNVQGAFAAGDVRAGSTKQLAFAVGDGAAAAIHIRQYLDRLDAEATE